MTSNDPWTQGYIAWEDSLGISENPYPEGTEYFHLWNSGFDTADSEWQEAEELEQYGRDINNLFTDGM